MKVFKNNISQSYLSFSQLLSVSNVFKKFQAQGYKVTRERYHGNDPVTPEGPCKYRVKCTRAAKAARKSYIQLNHRSYYNTLKFLELLINDSINAVNFSR